MPKKRRKLSSEFEKEIYLAKRRIELITAKINDIEDDSIQADYKAAFQLVRAIVSNLDKLYIETGFTPEAEVSLKLYKELVDKYEAEYEL